MVSIQTRTLHNAVNPRPADNCSMVKLNPTPVQGLRCLLEREEELRGNGTAFAPIPPALFTGPCGAGISLVPLFQVLLPPSSYMFCLYSILATAVELGFGIACIVKKGARATEGKHQNTKQPQGIIASAAPLVPLAQVVFSTASLVPPQAARSATESEFANFEDLFALLDPTPAVQTQGAAGAPVLHEDWPPLSGYPRRVQLPPSRPSLVPASSHRVKAPESAPPNGFEGIESNRFPVGSILHELFSPLPSWIVNNTAPPVPPQTAPVPVLDGELLALLNQNFPAPRLPVASHLQAIATLLEAAPPLHLRFSRNCALSGAHSTDPGLPNMRRPPLIIWIAWPVPSTAFDPFRRSPPHEFRLSPIHTSPTYLA
ncbi:hypothetical protein B0H14DRAFT_2642059 [Mycena olivaceomarginata]|nr:hypothetical protein B0H14DRAFT_2642059 [Mycena olivaceomarginata]